MSVDAGALRMTVRRLAGEDVLIELVGELDGPGRRCLRDQVGELLGRGGCTVTVDVGGLRRVDIAGLAALLRADLLLRRVRGALQIQAATPAFLELVAATGLTGRLRMVPAPRAAVADRPAVPAPSPAAGEAAGPVPAAGPGGAGSAPGAG